jgi:MFS family permease
MSKSDSLLQPAATGHGLRIWLVAQLVALPSLLYGYNFSAFNQVFVKAGDTKGSLLNDLDISLNQQQLVTAMVILGGWPASFAVAQCVSKYGIKKLLLLNNIVFVAGALLTGLATDVWMLIVGRLLR